MAAFRSLKYHSEKQNPQIQIFYYFYFYLSTDQEEIFQQGVAI